MPIIHRIDFGDEVFDSVSNSEFTIAAYTHIASEDDVHFAEQLGILRPNAPKNENGSGAEPPKPFVVN